MTFIAWLSRQLKRNSPTGDLARDVLSDIRDGWDVGDGSVQRLRGRMETLMACDAAMDALSRASHSYRSYVRTHSSC